MFLLVQKTFFSGLIENKLPITINKRIEIEKYTSDQVHMMLGFRTSIHSSVESISPYILSMLLAREELQYWYLS